MRRLFETGMPTPVAAGCEMSRVSLRLPTEAPDLIAAAALGNESGNTAAGDL
jgi:hypothetical protein